MTHDVPRPVVAMPTTSTLVRALAEACDDTLADTDNDGANPLARSSATLEPIALPDGRTATIRCSRSRRTGSLRVTVSFRAPRALRTAAAEVDAR